MNNRKTIAFITPYTFRGVGWLLYSGILDACNNNKINLITFNGEKLQEKSKRKQCGNIIYNFIDSKTVDGCIVWTSTLASGHLSWNEIYHFFKENIKQLPFISIGEKINEFPFITVDDSQAMEEMMEHLINFHHYKKIAFARGPDVTHSSSKKRFEKYIELLNKYSLPINDKLISEPLPFQTGSGRECVELFFKKRNLKPKEDIEVIFTTSDLIATEIIENLKYMKIKVPEEVAVIGFNNQMTAQSIIPPLTTIDIHYYYVGYKAVEMLQELIENKNVSETFIKATCLIRESCGCKNFSIINAGNPSITNIPSKEICDRLNNRNEELSLYYKNWAKIFYNSFISSVENNNDKFIQFINLLLNKIKSSTFDIFSFQDIISDLRNCTINNLKDEIKKERAENLFNQARVLINKIENFSHYKKIEELDFLSRCLNNITETFANTSNIEEILSKLEKVLQTIKVNNCFLFLYLDPKRENYSSKLVFNYINNKRKTIKNNEIYEVKKIIPTDFKKTKFNFTLKPLHFKENQIGFLVVETNKTNVNIIDTLAIQLSASLYGANIILEKEKINKMLKTNEEKYRNIVEASPNWIWITDENFTFTYSSLKVYNILAYLPIEVVNKKIFDFVIEEEKEKLKKSLLSSREKKVSYIEIESIFLNKYGKKIIIKLTAVPILDENKKITGYQGEGIDITKQWLLEKEKESLLKSLKEKNIELNKKVEERTLELKKLNEELKLAVEEAKKANEAKSRFLAKVSHEIRNPLNCIIGFSEILKESKRDLPYLEIILNESERLLYLANQLLDLSKIEAGKLSLNIEAFDLYQLINSMESSFKLLANMKGLNFYCYIDKKVPQYIYSDQVRLYQVINNLVNNAIKFTKEGKIELKLILKSKYNNYAVICFEISDTGIGISEGNLEKIFEAFYQIDKKSSIIKEGVGLGTTIAKEIVNLMNGKINVISKVNEGTKFLVEIPFMIAEEDEVTPSEMDTGFFKLKNEKTVLIVEDYKPNRELLKLHLENLGFKIFEAENGKEAVNIFNTIKIDIIFMDLNMDEMNGFEATKIIRKRSKDIVIIGCTGFGFSNEIEKCKEIGMNDVILKPYRKKEILNIINKYIELEYYPIKTYLKENTNLPFDYNFLLNEYYNNKEIILELLEDFINSSRASLPIMMSAIKNNDLTTLFNYAHKIKGASANLTLKEIANLAYKIENLAKEKNVKECIAIVNELSYNLEKLAEIFKDFKTKV